MVNLILVSHSYTLARGVAELAEQMNNGCQIAVAAGMSEPENAIGTDVVKIMMAIEEVYSPDGVLILMDLGSAILSAETALELIDPDMAANVKLCAAPLVEGALAAVVSASAGADLATVAKEAEAALGAKRSQLGEEQAVELEPDLTNQPPANALTFAWTVQNPHGLHIRPTAKLVEVLSPFSAQIWLEKDGKFVDAKSYNQIMQLQIRHQQPIVFHFAGAEAQAALDALRYLADQHFGEQLKVNSAGEQIQGEPVLAETSTGQAVTFCQFFAKKGDSAATTQDFAAKQQQVKSAFRQTQQQLAELAASMHLNMTFAGLFQAHQLLLDELQDEVFARLDEHSARAACEQVFTEIKTQYQQLDDPYLQARALDIDDLCHRVLHNLLGLSIPLPELHANSVLIADELYPSVLASVLATRFQGICLQQGDRYSHTALLAQAANVPLIVRCGEALTTIAQGDELQVNWTKGEVRKV